MRVAGGRELEFARERAIQKPGGQTALTDERELLDANALGVERLRAQSPAAQRIIDDADIASEELLAQAIFQKAGLARDRRAIDRADQVADQRAGNAWVEYDRHLAGFDLARIGAGDRTLAGAAADARGRNQIGGVRRGREVIVALQRGAFAGEGRHGDTLARAQVGAVETG